MFKSLVVFIAVTFSSFSSVQQDEIKLIQDPDGLIHFDFSNDKGELVSLALLRSRSTLASYAYDQESNMIALATKIDNSSHSGFYGKSFNHLLFKFYKFNKRDYSFDFLFQTGFQYDNQIGSLDYNFNTPESFQFEGMGDKGLIKFNFEDGTVAFKEGTLLAVKKMAALKTKIDSTGQYHFEYPDKFSLDESHESATLFK